MKAELILDAKATLGEGPAWRGSSAGISHGHRFVACAYCGGYFYFLQAGLVLGQI